jgi:hypothetical protein
MPLNQEETVALLQALKSLADALERQIQNPTPPETPSMWGATWQTVW